MTIDAESKRAMKRDYDTRTELAERIVDWMKGEGEPRGRLRSLINTMQRIARAQCDEAIAIGDDMEADECEAIADEIKETAHARNVTVK